MHDQPSSSSSATVLLITEHVCRPITFTIGPRGDLRLDEGRCNYAKVHLRCSAASSESAEATEPARTIPARWRLNRRLRENLGSAVTFALGIRKHIMHIHRSGSAQRLPSRPKLFSVLVELGTQNQKRLDHSMTVLLGEWRNVHTKLATESARIAGFSVLLECC